MKRVLFVIGQLTYGGSERQLFLTARGLQARFGVEVLCTSSATEPFGPRLQACGIPVASSPPGAKWRRFVWLIGYLRTCGAFNAIVFFSTHNIVALPIVLFKRGKKVFTERSLGTWKSPRYLFVDRLLYLFVDCILANSEATTDFVRTRFPRHATKLSVIPNGIEVPAESAVARSSRGETVFCLAAGFRPWKGHELLLEAVRILASENVGFHVILVGDGPLRESFERRILAEGLGDRFTFTGWQGDPGAYLSASDVVLNVSSHESLSNSLMEGMACGRPCIATRVGGNPELVEDGKTGLLIDSGAPDALANAMLTLIRDPDTGREWGKQGREKISEKFSVDSMVKRIGDLIDGL